MKLVIFALFVSVTIFSHDYFIYERTNTPIYFSVGKYTFPASWQAKKINAKGVSLKKSEQKRSKDVLIKALDKYPVELIKKNLKAIYVLEHLELYGQSYEGKNSSDAIYISNKGVRKGYSNFYIEQTFHHELSSILLKNFPQFLDKKKWKAINGKDFKYGKGGVIAVKKGNSGQFFYDKLNAKGLLTEYGKSSLENDLNIFAQNLFKPHKDFAKILKKHEKLEKKKKLLINFYNKIDKNFTEKFFENIENFKNK